MSPQVVLGPWIICPQCRGDGSVDTQGVVSRADFDDEGWEDYKAGVFNAHCSCCKGTGKVRDDGQSFNEANVRFDTVTGGRVQYADEDDASEHFLRMAGG